MDPVTVLTLLLGLLLIVGAVKCQNWKPGDYVDVTASGAKTGGTPYAVGVRAGLPANDIADAATDGVQTEGLIKCVKITGAFALDDPIYWDADGSPLGGTASSGAATNVESTATGDFLLGECAIAAGATDTTCIVRLNQCVKASRTATRIASYGSGVPLTIAAEDKVFQANGKIATDVPSSWYCGLMGSIEVTVTQSHNTSIFGVAGELDMYAAAATTFAQGNYAGVYGDLETSGTISFTSLFNWSAGVCGNIMGPGTAGTIASDSIAAAVLANVQFDAAPTYTDGYSILAGLAVRAGRYGIGGPGGIPIPFGIYIDRKCCTCDIRLQAGPGIYSKTSTPNGNLTAPQGSICLVTNGSSTSTRMFVNTDGGTTWTNFTSGA